MIEIFESKIGLKIKSFIEYKRSQGYLYKSRLNYFKQFDRYCLDNGNPELPTKELLEKFIDDKIESINSPYKSWISNFREFTRYLALTNDNYSYILSSKYVIKHMYSNPYCLTENDISIFFKKCFQLYRYPDSLGKHLTMPIYFLVLYCTGIRTFEATRLKVSDVHLMGGYFDIVKSKDNRYRRMFLNDDVIDILKDYNHKIETYHPNRLYFFSFGKDEPIPSATMNLIFKRIWKNASLKKESGKNPTQYSFRHHFAIRNILNWMNNHVNVDAMMPYLMRNMGHASIDTTYYYLHIIPDYFPEFKDKIKELESRIPEVVEYEEV